MATRIALDAVCFETDLGWIVVVGRAENPRRPRADRQAGDPVAVQVHRGQPERAGHRGAVAAVRRLGPGGTAGAGRSADSRQLIRPI